MTDSKKIILTSLDVNRRYIGNGVYGYEGQVAFDGKFGSVTLEVNDKFCQKIIDLCADTLVEVAQDMSEIMKGDIIESMSFKEVEKLK